MPTQATNIIDDQLREVLTGFPQITLAINWQIVYSIVSEHLQDVSDFARAVAQWSNLQHGH